jgi:hypothetical protein
MIETQHQSRDLGHLSLVVPPNLIAPGATETERPMTLTPIARNVEADLAGLRASCSRYLDEVESVREYYIEIGQSIARLIGDVGLHDMLLPRGYQVRCNHYEMYLLKLSPDGLPLFVASGQDDLFTRMGIGPRCELRTTDLAEFANDLNQGLVAEITAFVKQQLPSPQAITAADNASRPVPDDAAAASSTRAEQLRNLGRRARRAATS